MANDYGLLVIDDDKVLCETLEDILRMKGYRVDSANTGSDALRKLGSEVYSAVMLDIGLPDGDGSELLKTMKEKWPDTEVIIITGQGRLESAVKTLEAGAVAYLTKPLVVEEVIARLEEALYKRQLVRENKRMLADLATITAVITAMNRSLHLEDILERALDEVMRHTNLSGGAIFLLDEATETLTCRAAKGMKPELIEKLFLRDEKRGIAKEVAKSCQPLILENVSRYAEVQRLTSEEDILPESGALIPICSKGRALGIMAVFSPDAHQFAAKDIELLTTISEQIGVAIENAQLYEDSRRTAERLDVISDVIAAVHLTVDPREVFSRVASGLKKLVDFDRATISLLGEDRTRVRVFALAATEETALQEGQAQDVKGTATHWLMSNPTPLILQENRGNQQFASSELIIQENLKSAMVIPLFSEGAVIGSLSLSSKRPNNFSDKDGESLKPVAEQIAIALQKWRLYEKLKLQTSEMAAAYEQLKLAQESLIESEKLRALGVMASGVAHDINNHLAAIMLNAKLLSKPLKSRFARESIGAIRQAAMDCANTVRRIQEFAGLRSTKTFTSVDINQIVGDVIAITKPKWKDEAEQVGKEIKVTANRGDIAPIAGSPEDLRQALLNIVINAIDAISVQGEITISTKMRGNWVYISVKDTGIGMSSEVKQRIFDPFFTTKGSAGTGLGLATALGIILRHEGKISVDSTEGQGSTFTIRLPIKAGAPGESPTPMGQTQRASALIIEDEALIRDALCRILAAEGHRVSIASNGLEGIARYKQEKYDIVLTDLGMPGMSGWEVVRAIKDFDPESFVVLMTGWGEQLDHDKLKENEVDLVLAKPFDSEQVLRVIEERVSLKLKA